VRSASTLGRSHTHEKSPVERSEHSTGQASGQMTGIRLDGFIIAHTFLSVKPERGHLENFFETARRGRVPL